MLSRYVVILACVRHEIAAVPTESDKHLVLEFGLFERVK